MNQVYLPGAAAPLDNEALSEMIEIKKPDIPAAIERLRNGNICECLGKGEFEIMSKNIPGETVPYMRCRRCRCVSPLYKK